ncbi:hypothetical protein [Bathycoccus sp. RCC716 virus 3]|nr:hypothetical protein [Bathycoccus sp. RCC716 virus 3]|tara:strand:- start:2190 stop:2426 length:237 start_codon:yes stop_codon:yes gene_type:complete
MLIAADFDQAYSTKACNYEQPPCEPPACFVGSYAPVAKVGDPNGKFFINSSLLQPNRLAETKGPTTVRSEDFKCGSKK